MKKFNCVTSLVFCLSCCSNMFASDTLQDEQENSPSQTKPIHEQTHKPYLPPQQEYVRSGDWFIGTTRHIATTPFLLPTKESALYPTMEYAFSSFADTLPKSTQLVIAINERANQTSKSGGDIERIYLIKQLSLKFQV